MSSLVQVVVADLTDRFRLDGKVAIVTGASSGLGVAFALALAEVGASVAVGARRVDRLHATAAMVESRGQRSIAVSTDVTNPEECHHLVEETMREFGKVDVLVNNAGIASACPASRESPDAFQRVIDVNLCGSYWMAQAGSRVMGSGSAIVNIGSVLGQKSAGLPQAAYSSSKAAIVALTRDLAQQWARRKGIRVNAIAPGFFVSEMTSQYRPEYFAEQIDRTPLGRTGEPEELCSALVFLASEASSYITGITLPVDGGYLTS